MLDCMFRALTIFFQWNIICCFFFAMKEFFKTHSFKGCVVLQNCNYVCVFIRHMNVSIRYKNVLYDIRMFSYGIKMSLYGIRMSLCGIRMFPLYGIKMFSCGTRVVFFLRHRNVFNVV